MNIIELREAYDKANTENKWQIIEFSIRDVGVTELWKENKKEKDEYAKYRNSEEKTSVLLWHYVGRRIPIINKWVAEKTLEPKHDEYYWAPTWHYEFWKMHMISSIILINIKMYMMHWAMIYRKKFCVT